jgi:hypothetical protein
MMAIDDDMLMAFVDGELDEVNRVRVERAIAEDPALKARLEQQQRLRDRLAAHYGPAVEEEVPERFRALFEANVVPFAAAKSRPTRPLWQSLTALAATLMLGLAIGRTLLAPGAAGPFAVEGGTMVARGELASALDTQLASTQPQDSPTRIGVSFTNNDGRTCRTFDSQAAAGVACRRDAGWQVMMTAAGSGGQRTDYRQAGSANMLVQQTAQEMMAGEPYDDAAERRARDSGWRSSTPRR